MPKGKNPKPKGKDSVHFKHGFAWRLPDGKRHPLYLAWVNLRQRCTNTTTRDYKFYGARGIKVCEKWNSFKNFYEDMFPTYEKGLTLDRINVNGDYCPENCRWATRREQSNNRNYNRLITYKEKTQSVGSWAYEIGMSQRALHKRIFTRGWAIERALTQPLRKN